MSRDWRRKGSQGGNGRAASPQICPPCPAPRFKATHLLHCPPSPEWHPLPVRIADMGGYRGCVDTGTPQTTSGKWSLNLPLNTLRDRELTT